MTPFGCTMSFTASYAAGTLTIDATLGTTVARQWNVWLVYAKSTAKKVQSILVPVSPAGTHSVSFALPPKGEVGILSTLQTPKGGVACAAFDTVSTTP